VRIPAGSRMPQMLSRPAAPASTDYRLPGVDGAWWTVVP
jgi:hypothetical protein